MHVKINVPAEWTDRLRESAATADLNIEEFVLKTLSERLAIEQSKQPTGDGESFSKGLSDWSNQFPVLANPVDDSRDSIYAGRDE